MIIWGGSWLHRGDGSGRHPQGHHDPRIHRDGNSLAAQWLGLCTFTAMGPGSIPGQGTEIPQDAGHGQKTKQNKTKRINRDYGDLSDLVNHYISSNNWR